MVKMALPILASIFSSTGKIGKPIKEVQEEPILHLIN